MNNLNLLYLEDDIEVRENVVFFLERFFSNIYTAADGNDAYEIFSNKKVHLLLLDLNVPKMNGVNLAKKVRETNQRIPIIFLSAYYEREKLLEILKVGVTSYIVKPFKVEELLSTIKDTIKMISEEEKTTNEHILGDSLIWNKDKKSLTFNENVIHLTNNEILLTDLFTDFQHKIFTLNEIIEDLFPHDDLQVNTVTQLISRFKRKLVTITNNEDFFIENIYKKGYKFR